MQGEIWSYKALPSPLDPLWTKPTALQLIIFTVIPALHVCVAKPILSLLFWNVSQ